MAECSYARCVQQRRNIRRELQRWTKNMVHIVGLERIAEELMGRRKWKLYQESMSRNYLQTINNNIGTNQQSSPAAACMRNDLNADIQQDNGQKRQADGVEDEIVRITGALDETSENGRRGREDEEDGAKDWTPPSKCYFCIDGKLDPSENVVQQGVLSPRNSDSESTDSPISDNEVPPSLTPSSNLLNNNNNNSNNNNNHRTTTIAPSAANMTTIESVTSMAALAAVAALSGATTNAPAGAPATAHHLPFYAPGMLTHNWYLANVARTFQAERAASHANDGEKNGGEQPLDLSKGAAGQSEKASRLANLDTKQIFNSDSRAKPRMSTVAGRRTYTEDELQAALRDIQSGKLGTRRAAVIYGIPRSTLRNKVYKLALERERESHLNPPTVPLKIDDDETMEDEKELSGAEEEKEVEKALQAPLLCIDDILRFSTIETQSEAMRLLAQKSKDSGAGGDQSQAVENPDIVPYFQNLLLASQNLLTNQKISADPTLVAQLLPEFMKRVIGDDKTNNGDEKMMMLGNRHRSESDMETDETPSNVILKIPSFRPTSSKNGGCEYARAGGGGVPISASTDQLASPSVTSESCSPPILTPPAQKLTIKDVKDVIAQSISQKFQQQQQTEATARRPDVEYKRFTPPLAGVIKPPPPTNEMGRGYAAPKPQTSQPPPSQSGSGGKGTRPKRGKYRNYDRDSLVEAVRAVQRGEMSVHRAGSYYGVPHSTLEYKVKERHLMRPRKRDPKPNPVDEKIASLKQNDMRTAGSDKTPLKTVGGGGGILKPPPGKFPTTASSPNGMKLPIFEPGMAPPLPGYNAPPPPFPFWPHPTFHHLPLEYARNPTQTAAPPFPPNPEFFASQMMQKLQEESARTGGNVQPALAKSARQIAESLLDGGGANGSFLDGIIRSSLESGVPTTQEDKKEDRNAAPENMSNKALLDQLCKNSRLTPLPKAPDQNSGDESYRKSPLDFATGTKNTSPPLCDVGGADLHTIELSNDSSESTTTTTTRKCDDDFTTTKTPPPPPPPARIYLNKDLANPDNLQPEMLVRFRDILPDVERNGGGDGLLTGSASDNDAPQD